MRSHKVPSRSLRISHQGPCGSAGIFHQIPRDLTECPAPSPGECLGDLSGRFLAYRIVRSVAPCTSDLRDIAPELEIVSHAVFHDARIASKRQRLSVARNFSLARYIKCLQGTGKLFSQSVALAEFLTNSEATSPETDELKFSRDCHPSRAFCAGICFSCVRQGTADPPLRGETICATNCIAAERGMTVCETSTCLMKMSYAFNRYNKSYFAFIAASTSSAVCGRSFVICTRFPC